MKWAVAVLVLMLCVGTVAAESGWSKFWNSLTKKSPQTTENAASFTTLSTDARANEVSRRPWVAANKAGIYCSALRGVFEDFYNAGYYVKQLDVNDDKAVTLSDLTLFSNYYAKRSQPAVQAWCKKQLLNPVAELPTLSTAASAR